jgi:hypothetical protein
MKKFFKHLGEKKTTEKYFLLLQNWVKIIFMWPNVIAMMDTGNGTQYYLSQCETT